MRKLHALLSMRRTCFDRSWSPLRSHAVSVEAMVNGKKQIENRSWKIPMGWWRRMGRGCGQNGIGSTYTNHFTNPHKCVCVLLSEACHVECTWICPRVDVQQIAFGLSQSFAFWRFSLASFCVFVSLCEFVQVGMHCTLEGDPWQCWGRIGFGGSFVSICSNLLFWSTVFEVTCFTASCQNAASWCFMGFLEMKYMKYMK